MTIPGPPTVIFCPLNWGLGHISRDLPLMKSFIEKGYRVIAATAPPLTQWLEKELPGIEILYFPGPKIHYSRTPWQIPILLLQLPSLLKCMHNEKKFVRNLVEKYHPSLIISDNRYGARNKDVFSVIITHQLMIKLPWYMRWGERLLHRFICLLTSRFNECWVPDYSKPHSLAGDLTQKYPLPKNARLIGPLSRFDDHSIQQQISSIPETKNLLAILSGPEPQRSILEKKLKHNLRNHNMKGLIITGHPASIEKTDITSNFDGIALLPHLSTLEMAKTIKNHKIIICRSGYSSIMDLHFLKKKAWLIPTPGQTEQVYLSEFHKGKNHNYLSQANLHKQKFRAIYPKSPSPINTEEKTENFRYILNEFWDKKPLK